MVPLGVQSVDQPLKAGVFAHHDDAKLGLRKHSVEVVFGNVEGAGRRIKSSRDALSPNDIRRVKVIVVEEA